MEVRDAVLTSLREYDMLSGADRVICALSGGALARAEALSEGRPFRVWVSVTHESGSAAATAIIEMDSPSPPPHSPTPNS